MDENDVIFAPRFDLGTNYLADYFGLWAIHDTSILRAVERIQGIDIRGHVTKQAVDGESSKNDRYMSRDGIAMISITGPTMKFVPSMAEGTSTVLVRRQLKAAARDPDVKGVLLVMDTPGGTSKGNEDLASEVAKLAAVKPVFVFVEDMTASAGVSVASQATRRYANNATAVYGAIGTYAVLQDMSGMAEKLGVKVHVVRAGDFKGAGTPGTEITEDQLSEVQRVVNRVNESYLQLIATGLGRTIESIRPLADGRVILASDAVSAGLLNGVQSFEATYQELVQFVSRSAPTRGGAKNMSAENAATLAQLKATFPKSSAEWRESQLEAGASIGDAAVNYAKHIEEKAEAEREQHRKDLEAAKNSKPATSPSLGHEPLTAANVAGELENGMSGDPREDFDAAVRARLPKNREPSFDERQNAIAYVARMKPSLHRAYIEATNKKAGPRVSRLIAEKYDTAN